MREMTYVSDVVDATMAALQAPSGGVYNVGGGARTTVDELVDHVRRTLSVRVEAAYEPTAEGDVYSTWADLELVRRDLGYRPQVGLKRGIEAQVEWAREETIAPGWISGSPSKRAAR